MAQPTESKIVIHQAGDYDALLLEHYEGTAPAQNEISIDVHAAGVNYADCVIRMGLYKSANELHGYPITPGFEVAGIVTSVGKDVSDFSIGDKVIGITLFGGYCSQICLPATQAFKCPANLTLEQAAGVLTVYLTAWFALHYLANLQAGEHVLVHSGAGGVGLAALQLAKRASAKVTAVVGAKHKVDVALDFAADNVIDKSTQALWHQAEKFSPQGYNVILDPNGYSTLQQSYKHLAPLGKLVIYGFHSMLPQGTGRPNYLKLARDWLRTPRFNPLNMTADNKSVMAFNLSFLSDRTTLLAQAMNDILEGITEGSLRALPYATYVLKDASKAQQKLETGQTTGKLVLLSK